MAGRLNYMVGRRKRTDTESDATTVARGANRAEFHGAVGMGLMSTD
jgi:hypothetical protein